MLLSNSNEIEWRKKTIRSTRVFFFQIANVIMKQLATFSHSATQTLFINGSNAMGEGSVLFLFIFPNVDDVNCAEKKKQHKDQTPVVN